MTELQFHTGLCWAVIGLGAIVFVSLFFVVAPYGRHTRGGWGFTIPSKLGWVMMEGLGVVGFAICFSFGAHATELVPMALCTLWLVHYVHRSFIFPLRMKSGTKPMPLSVALMAIVFNGINAYLNSRWISQLGEYPLTWLTDPRFIIGVVLFAVGMGINIHSDNILFSLRKPGEQGYKIPYGGGYRWVTSPNYLGELLEWSGWALATWSLPGLTFLIFTFANLAPRALSHHKWYRATFPEYPKTRRAVLPFVL